MKILIPIIFSVLAGAANADCSLDLDQVLTRYVEARGGVEAIEAQQGLRLISINHEGKWNPTFDYRTKKPNYMWIAAIYDDGEVILEGFDGENAWEKWGAKPAEFVSGDAKKALSQGALSPVHLYGLHHMATLGAVVALRECARLEDREYHVINVRSTFGTDIDYWVRAEDYVLERARATRPLHPTQDPTPIVIEERWSDFRMVEGVLHPFRTENWDVSNDKRLNWLEVLRIEPLSGMEAGSFGKPE